MPIQPWLGIWYRDWKKLYSGATSHQLNGIVVQPLMYSLELPMQHYDNVMPKSKVCLIQPAKLSLSILCPPAILVNFNKVLYAKEVNIVWKNTEKCHSVMLWFATFYTMYNLFPSLAGISKMQGYKNYMLTLVLLPKAKLQVSWRVGRITVLYISTTWWWKHFSGWLDQDSWFGSKQITGKSIQD